jgi:hypothetical protein
MDAKALLHTFCMVPRARCNFTPCWCWTRSAGPVTGHAPIRWLASMLSTGTSNGAVSVRYDSMTTSNVFLLRARFLVTTTSAPCPLHHCTTAPVPLTSTVHRANSADTVSKRKIARLRARYACCALDSSAERPRRHVPSLLLAHCLACTVYQARYTCPLVLFPVYLSTVHPCPVTSLLFACLSVYPLRLLPPKPRVPCSHIGPFGVADLSLLSQASTCIWRALWQPERARHHKPTRNVH